MLLFFSALLAGIFSGASAAPKTGVLKPVTHTGVVHQGSDPLPVFPDLTCQINVTCIDGLTLRIVSNGATLSNGGVLLKQLLCISVYNHTFVDARNFHTAVTVTGADTNEPLSFDIPLLASHQSIQKYIWIKTYGLTHHVNISVTADSAGQVAESNEGNNSASFNYTINNVF